MEKGNAKALLPIGVFLVMYLGLGLLFEYVLLIPMGFYNIPIVVSFLTALLVACVQNPKLKFDAKIKVMAKELIAKCEVKYAERAVAAGEEQKDIIDKKSVHKNHPKVGLTENNGIITAINYSNKSVDPGFKFLNKSVDKIYYGNINNIGPCDACVFSLK